LGRGCRRGFAAFSTARCCPLAKEEGDESGEVFLLPLLSEPSSDPEMEELLSF